jgi:hypothetical protein
MQEIYTAVQKANTYYNVSSTQKRKIGLKVWSPIYILLVGFLLGKGNSYKLLFLPVFLNGKGLNILVTTYLWL